MRHCWSAWLLALCLVSVQLLVAAQNLSPPALTPPLVKEVDDLVRLFLSILLNFYRFLYFSYTHYSGVFLVEVLAR